MFEIDLAWLVAHIVGLAMGSELPRLSDRERRELESELICTIGFGGLKPVKRVFI